MNGLPAEVVQQSGDRSARVAGLSQTEAARRLREDGANELVPAPRQTTLWSWILRLVTDPMALLLMVTAGTYLILGDRLDATIAAVALLPIFLVSAALEQRSERALEHLRDAVAPVARVRRDGLERTVSAREIVLGDVMLVREGEIIVADGELVEGLHLSCDESSLTGESIPVDKTIFAREALEREMFAGTTVVAGSGAMLVTATGRATRYGRIGGLLAEIESSPTPIERAIRKVFAQSSLAVFVVCIAVIALGRSHGDPWPAAIIAGVSLAMAAMPEELPMVYTLYLALGAWRLSRDRALVRRLGSVETLGATSVICVDKTGTVTFGQIELVDVLALNGDRDDVLRTAALASDREAFDPLDRAIFRAFPAGRALLERGVLEAQQPFDPRRKSASSTWSFDGQRLVAQKGALEALLVAAENEDARSRATRWAEDMAKSGRRVIAVAKDAKLLGLLAFADTIRPDVASSVAECRHAGIRVVMITGDHPLTASAIACSIGLEVTPSSILTGDVLESMDDAELADRIGRVVIFARTRPEHKLRIVRALRRTGAVVAMTGDGTNDALALREADIGVAMGKRGTDVARGAADLVLLDDDFSTVVRAVRDGRRIFENLRRAFCYLVSFHAPLLVTATVIPFVGAPLLLMPIHLVFLELVVHPTSSLVFEAEPAPPNLMGRPPRRADIGLLQGHDWLAPLAVGAALALAVLGLYLFELKQGESTEVARATAFVAMVVGQAALVLVQRSPDIPLWRAIRVNRPLAIALPVTLASLPLGVYMPGLNEALHFAPLSPALWGTAFGVGAAATLWFVPFKRLRR